MIKHKNKIIAAIIIATALAVAWLAGGGPLKAEQTGQTPDKTIESESVKEPDGAVESLPEQETDAPASDLPEPSDTPVSDSPEQTSAPKPSAPNTPQINEAPERTSIPSVEAVNTPSPTEPQNTAADAVYTCSLSVRCDTILDNISRLDKEKLVLVPADGVVFKNDAVVFDEGESVFDVLQRELRQAKLHMSFRNTPIYNSAYVEAIGNLYEFDCGELSGWTYKVNESFPSYSASRHKLNPGDVVEWVYTCDLGRDVGDIYYSSREAD